MPKPTSSFRVARVTARAQQVFAGQPAYAAAWLREPESSLGDRTPLQLLATESGALAGEEQLIGSNTECLPKVIVWRFSRHESLDGRGGLLASARWHTRGRENAARIKRLTSFPYPLDSRLL